VRVVTMVRGTRASYGEVTSWLTLGSPGPRPNPQKLLVLARDLLVVAPRPDGRRIPMTSGTAARDQGPGTGAAPRSAFGHPVQPGDPGGAGLNVTAGLARGRGHR
jgi:hypothetical protein